MSVVRVLQLVQEIRMKLQSVLAVAIVSAARVLRFVLEIRLKLRLVLVR